MTLVHDLLIGRLKFCPACGSTVRPARILKGSFLFECALLVITLPAAFPAVPGASSPVQSAQKDSPRFEACMDRAQKAAPEATEAKMRQACKELEEGEKSLAEYEAFAKTKAGKVCKKHPDWSRSTCEDIAAHVVRIGMTRQQACEAWTGGWLRIGPRLVNRTVTADGVYEQWVREEMGPTRYSRIYNFLYFTNGILTSYQLAR